VLALDFVGLDANDLIIRSVRELGPEVAQDFFEEHSNGRAACWQLIRARRAPPQPADPAGAGYAGRTAVPRLTEPASRITPSTPIFQ
jgi:hypothetical protein